MTLEQAQDWCESRYGEQGVAMIDGSLRHEVGFFEDPIMLALGAFIRTGCGGNFEEAIDEAVHDPNEMRWLKSA